MSPKHIFATAGMLIALIIIPFACKTKPPVVVTPPPPLDCSTVEASYSKDIAPIIAGYCASCHGYGSLNGDFTNYAGLSGVAKNGKLEYHLFKKQDMPPYGNIPVNAEGLKKIRCWLNNGSMNN